MVRRSGRLHAVLRRVPLACLVLLITGTMTASGRLFARRVDEMATGGESRATALPVAYGEEISDLSRFTTTLVYTSLDAPGEGEARARVTWDDAWFARDDRAYNHELAQTSSVLAALAYAESAHYHASADRPAYMENALASLGFDEASTESYRYRTEVIDEVLNMVTDDADGVAYTIARKRLAPVEDSDSAAGVESVDAEGSNASAHAVAVEGSNAFTGADKRKSAASGAPRDLILVSVRGSYGSEWLSNLDLSRDESDDHGGYCRASQEICHEVASWARESTVGGAEVSVLLVGHSRGGAIANLVAAQMDDCRSSAQGSSKAGAQNDAAASSFGADAHVLSRVDRVYAYTFASPATTLSARARTDTYANIFNIANPSDIMPYLPLGAWGYERYGVDIDLPTVGDEGFEERHDRMRRVYEESVGVACAADPTDAQIAREVVSDIASGIASVEELTTPQGAQAVFTSVAMRVNPIRILYSHYPSTYIAWMYASKLEEG